MLGEKMKKLIIVVDESTKPYGELLSALITLKDDNDEHVVGVKDGSVEAVVWDEKTYQNNEAQLSSTNKVIFIGENRVSKPVASNIYFDNDFSEYGIMTGSLGNKAAIYVEKRKINNASQYDEFLAAYAGMISGYKVKLISSQNTEPVKLSGKDDIDEKKDEVSGKINTIVGKGFKGLNKGFAEIQKASSRIASAGGIETDIEAKPIEISEEAASKTSSFISKAVNSAWSTKAAENITFDLMNAKSGKAIIDQQYRCAVISFYVNELADFME